MGAARRRPMMSWTLILLVLVRAHQRWTRLGTNDTGDGREQLEASESDSALMLWWSRLSSTGDFSWG
jgi:hypothetical protein